MIYTLTKGLALALMKAPTEPPDPPAGAHDHTQVYRASPGFLTYRLLLYFIIGTANGMLALGLLFVGVIMGETPLIVLGFVYLIVLAVGLFCVYFAIRIDYDMRYYVVTDRSLRVREGAFIVKEKTISFANVQNMRVVQGPLLRWFGIKHLAIDTAGGSAPQPGHGTESLHQVRMAGVDNADAVRADIQRHLRTWAGSAGLGDPDDHDDDVRSVPVGDAMLAALRELKSATAALRSTL